MPSELAADYYLQNFQSLLQHVVDRYDDLLSEAELQAYQQFQRLPIDAQRLYVRMLTRKGHLFRWEKFQYAEIGNVAEAIKALNTQGFIEDYKDSEWLSLFSKSELIAMMKAKGVPTKGMSAMKRGELDECISRLEFACPQGIVRLDKQDLFETFRLLYFGNLHQSLTDFVLQDLGIYRYAEYSLDKQTRLFSQRSHIDRQLQFYEYLERLDEVLQAEREQIVEFARGLPTASSDEPLLERRLERVKLKLARQLERLQADDEAILLYGECSRAPARERRVRLYYKKGDFQRALTLCEDIFENPLIEEEAEFAEFFAYKIQKKLGQHLSVKTKYSPPSSELTLSYYSGLSVEQRVASHLEPSGSSYYIENSLFSGIFVLYYWDVIFADIQGAFTHPYQMRPHDLYDDDFFSKRKALTQPLQNIWPDAEFFVESFHRYQGTANAICFWGGLDEALIRIALQRIPAKHWQLIFKRLMADVRANRSGFPDLIHFPASGGYELVEVKGPGDTLQKNQIRWLAYFAEHDIPHRVEYVRWSD